MQALCKAMQESSQYHIAIQGHYMSSEHLVAIPNIVPRGRSIRTPLVETMIITGGTKGLGLEYAKRVRKQDTCDLMCAWWLFHMKEPRHV